jgi:hypothetical protein
MTHQFGGDESLRQVVHALLLEWTLDVEVSRGMNFVDFVTTSLAPIGMPVRQRYRLFLEGVRDADLTTLREVANAAAQTPVAIAPRGSTATIHVVELIDAERLADLADRSAVLSIDGDGNWTVDSLALGDLTDSNDTSLALVNGLLLLRPLARDRVPPSLRAAGRPAHELFERCFFTVMTSSFGARGTSWGTERRGEVRPDGLLELGNVTRPVIYDCKASFVGYRPAYRDILGFADYVNHPVGWTPPTGVLPRLLVVSSEFQMRGKGSFAHRKAQLHAKAPGVDLTTVRARDLARFGLGLERSSLPLAGRLAIDWEAIFAAGEVRWEDFELQVASLRSAGFSVEA